MQILFTLEEYDEQEDPVRDANADTELVSAQRLMSNLESVADTDEEDEFTLPSVYTENGTWRVSTKSGYMEIRDHERRLDLNK